MTDRRLSLTDQLLARVEHALHVTLGPAPPTRTESPAAGTAAVELAPSDREHAAGLMRINHAGEVCAQALYLGQAAVTRDAGLRAHLLDAAAEEADHLAWCAERLAELDSAPSRLNPFWFAGSWTIGGGAGRAGPRYSLGFVVETERQVEAHLGDHLRTLPAADARSRAIVARMQTDEAQHGKDAQAAGARELPQPIPQLMTLAANFMKWAAYRG
jgi:ubiquinone biosynthesis monooxygenase Coq7